MHTQGRYRRKRACLLLQSLALFTVVSQVTNRKQNDCYRSRVRLNLFVFGSCQSSRHSCKTCSQSVFLERLGKSSSLLLSKDGTLKTNWTVFHPPAVSCTNWTVTKPSVQLKRDRYSPQCPPKVDCHSLTSSVHHKVDRY